MKFILSALLFTSAPAFAFISAIPSSVNFFNVRTDGIGQTQTVYVYNNGSTATRVTVSNSCFGDYYVTDLCGLTLNAGMSCTITVRFAPRRAGYQNCSIWAYSSEGGSANISVMGQGVD